MNTCPTCGSESLTPVTYSNEFMRVPRQPESGYITVDNLQGTECSVCHNICAFPSQIRYNEALINQTRNDMTYITE